MSQLGHPFYDGRFEEHWRWSWTTTTPPPHSRLQEALIVSGLGVIPAPLRPP